MEKQSDIKELIDIAKDLPKKERYAVYKKCRKLKFSGKVLKFIRILNNTIDKENKENAIYK